MSATYRWKGKIAGFPTVHCRAFNSFMLKNDKTKRESVSIIYYEPEVVANLLMSALYFRTPHAVCPGSLLHVVGGWLCGSRACVAVSHESRTISSAWIARLLIPPNPCRAPLDPSEHVLSEGR